MVYELDPTSLQSHKITQRLVNFLLAVMGLRMEGAAVNHPKKYHALFGQLQCQKQAGPEVSGIYNAYPIDRNIQLPLKLHVYKNKSDLPTAFVSPFASEK